MSTYVWNFAILSIYCIFWPCCTTFSLFLRSPFGRAWKITYMVKIWRCNKLSFVLKICEYRQIQLKKAKLAYILNFWPCCTPFSLFLRLPIDRAWKITYTVQIWHCGKTLFMESYGDKIRYIEKRVNLGPGIATFFLKVTFFRGKKFRFV